MPTDRSRTWDGGYIRTDSKGRDVYYIRKRIEGELYDISTRATSSAAANEQWKRFQANPGAYRPGGAGDGTASLTLDVTRAFLSWSRDEKKNTPKWVSDQKRALIWWTERLGAVDIRRVHTKELVDALDGTPARKQKIATLKTFCAWLIEVRHRMDAHEDPTAGLMVPQARPEQWTNPKTFTRAQFRAVRAKLGAPWGDAADVLAATGWHFEELARFAAGVGSKVGAVEKHPRGRGQVLACPQTKSGEPLRTSVSDVAARAARRLLGRTLDYFEFRKALRAACREAGLPASAVQPGTFRHAVSTWAVNSGAHPAAVSAFLNHKSVQTTRRFYATHAVPAKVPTLR